MRRKYKSLAVASTWMWLGCAQSTTIPSTPDTGSTTQSLSVALEECGDRLDACDQSDTGCSDDFMACEDAAVDDAVDAIDDAAGACRKAFSDCKAEAEGGAAIKACSKELSACVASEIGGTEVDSDDDNGHRAPVAACIDALHECIAGDAAPRTCTQPLPVCLRGAVSQGEAHRNAAAKGERGRSAGRGARADAADAGGNASDAESRACRDAGDACLADGGSLRECARERRDCVSAP